MNIQFGEVAKILYFVSWLLSAGYGLLILITMSLRDLHFKTSKKENLFVVTFFVMLFVSPITGLIAWLIASGSIFGKQTEKFFG